MDLRDTDLPKGDVPLDLDVGIGEARVIVPDDVCVATDADVGVGNVAMFGRDHGGVDVDYEDAPDRQADRHPPAAARGRRRGRAARAQQPRASSTSTTTTSGRSTTPTRPRLVVGLRDDRAGEQIVRGRPDIPALVAGLAVLALGGVLLLDALDVFDLSFAVFAPVACAAAGAILVANGLSRGQ